MASQTLIDALRQFGEFDDPYEEPGTCRDCSMCWHGEQPYELVGNEELRGELVYGWGICTEGQYPRLVELDGEGCA